MAPEPQLSPRHSACHCVAGEEGGRPRGAVAVGAGSLGDARLSVILRKLREVLTQKSRLHFYMPATNQVFTRAQEMSVLRIYIWREGTREAPAGKAVGVSPSASASGGRIGRRGVEYLGSLHSAPWGQRGRRRSSHTHSGGVTALIDGNKTPRVVGAP